MQRAQAWHLHEAVDKLVKMRAITPVNHIGLTDPLRQYFAEKTLSVNLNDPGLIPIGTDMGESQQGINPQRGGGRKQRSTRSHS